MTTWRPDRLHVVTRGSFGKAPIHSLPLSMVSKPCAQTYNCPSVITCGLCLSCVCEPAWRKSILRRGSIVVDFEITKIVLSLITKFTNCCDDNEYGVRPRLQFVSHAMTCVGVSGDRGCTHSLRHSQRSHTSFNNWNHVFRTDTQQSITR